MDIDGFVGKYGPEWSRLEAATQRGVATLPGPEIDEVVRLYLRVSGHLAEAQARYRDRDLIAYLSALVARCQGQIYGTRSASLAGILSAFTVRYRDAVRETAPFILLSAASFLVVLGVSLLWVATSPEARAGLIPPQAQDAIERFGGTRGDLGIGSGALSTAILINNIQVAILAFSLGITFGAGTVAVLILNAVNIGVLAGGFAAVGKAGPFWAIILPHGLLELTAIFIASGAGLRVGWALVAPGDRHRAESLREAAGRAVLLITGVIPAFIVAGFIEGFLSGTGISSAVQLSVGSAAWIAYVVFLAWPVQGGRSQLAGGLGPEVLVGHGPRQALGGPVDHGSSQAP